MKAQHCVILPVALLLLGGGLATLILFGLGNIKPYGQTKSFKMANCTVVTSNLTDDVACPVKTEVDRPEADTADQAKVPSDRDVTSASNSSHFSLADNASDVAARYEVYIITYPCLVIVVNYSNTVEEVQRSNVLLYDSYFSFLSEESAGLNHTCSIQICDVEQEAENQDTIAAFQESHGVVGQRFKCYYNPARQEQAFAYIVTETSVLHTLIWPSLAMGFGLFLLIVFIFQSCEVWICRNPKLQRRSQGEMYELAPSHGENSRDYRNMQRNYARPRTGEQEVDEHRPPTAGSSSKKSRPLTSAADIVRKLSSHDKRKSDGSGSFHGTPSGQWSIGKNGQKQFSTT